MTESELILHRAENAERALEQAEAEIYAMRPLMREAKFLLLRYASECGECAGAGVLPDEVPCVKCLDVRKLVARLRAA